MSQVIDVSTLELALLVARGLLIVALLHLLGRLVALAPMPRARKERLRAAGPPFAVCVVLVYALLVIKQLFGAHGEAMPAMLAVVLIGFVAALWTPIRDLLAGAFIKSGGNLRLGDDIQVQQLQGRIERLGYRGLTLRTHAGETFVPYGLCARSVIVRSASTPGASAHTFRVRPIAGVSQLALRQAIRESALLCHWTAIAKQPEIVNLEQGAVDVTVFAVDSELAPEIEAAVRRRLAELERGGRDPEAAGRLSQLPLAQADAGSAPQAKGG